MYPYGKSDKMDSRDRENCSSSLSNTRTTTESEQNNSAKLATGLGSYGHQVCGT